MYTLKKSAISLISLVIFLISSPIEIVQHVWCQLVLGQDTARSIGQIQNAYAKVLTTTEEAIHALLPDVDQISKEVKSLTTEQMNAIEDKAKVRFNSKFDQKFVFYVGHKENRATYYVVHDRVRGKWGPIDYMLSLDPAGQVADVIVLQYEEKRGRPVAKRRFLKQFIGKGEKDLIRLRKDIRGVTGASISSRGMTDGIRKMVHVFNEFYVGK
jgi:Na+-translocating ferredoxin:NAD+ oxidoreductase RnfG subunit